jgi:hypothetical protein
MIFEIGSCTVEIDETATREYYREHPEPYDCDCEICRAYIKHAEAFPNEVRAFFASCGIDDMLYVNEVSGFGDDGGGTIPVEGWFFAVGSMRGGTPPTVWHSKQYEIRRAFAKRFDRKRYDEMLELERISELERMSGEYKVCDGFSVRFSNRSDLVPEGFPKNRVQINFETELPD